MPCGDGVARGPLEVAHELVPRELGILLVPAPGVAVVGPAAQDDGVELIRRHPSRTAGTAASWVRKPL